MANPIHQLAADMLDSADAELPIMGEIRRVNPKLLTFIDRAVSLVWLSLPTEEKERGSGLRSRQIIATLIASWEAINPDEISYNA